MVISFFYINGLSLMDLKWKSLAVLLYFILYCYTVKELFRPCTYLLISYAGSFALAFPVNWEITLIVWILNIVAHGIIIQDYPKLMGDTMSSVIWGPYIAAMQCLPKHSSALRCGIRYSIGPPYYLEDMVSDRDLDYIMRDIKSDTD